MAGSQHETWRPVSNCDNEKVPMDLQEKQPAVIKFLLFEAHPGDKIAALLQDGSGKDAHYRASVFQWIQVVH
jgi:ABC-type transport system involved in cytochrome bd biosynthesis fused ATPase/permease subunit